MTPAAQQDESILAALVELDRWRRRRSELRGRKADREELARVNRQVAYYEALVRDMKREARPASFQDFLGAIR